MKKATAQLSEETLVDGTILSLRLYKHAKEHPELHQPYEIGDFHDSMVDWMRTLMTALAVE